MKYTYLIDISDIDEAWKRLEKRTRYGINKCKEEVYIADDISRFDELHKISRPDRKISSKYLSDLYKDLQPNCALYFTRTAGAFISWDNDTAYYLFAGREKTVNDYSPTVILWRAIKDAHNKGLKQFDLCGANKPSITLFKRGFGGKLVQQVRTYIPQW